MGDGIHKDILNILRYHIITPLQKSTGLGHVKQSYPCSWTRSPIYALIVSCRLQQLNDVMIKGIVYKHLPAGLLHFQNLGALRDTLHTIALRILLTLEDFNFIMLLRITDFQADHETVQLTLRELLCSCRAVRILCRNHQKRLFQRHGYPVHADTALFHYLQ